MNKTSIASEWVDPDDPPIGDREWFETADLYIGEKLIRRGRLPSDGSKVDIALRLDPDVVAKFEESGFGWQKLMNEALRKAAGL